MQNLLKEFIERGQMEPSDREWASLAFFVLKKKKGELRLVVNYRGLNEQPKHDSYSLPFMEPLSQKQAQKRIFAVLDLENGCHQMRLHENSRACTAMSTSLRPGQWRELPMGGKNGNSVFRPTHDAGSGGICAGLRWPVRG